MRSTKGGYPPLGGASPETLLWHRELQYLREPTDERYRKLNEARAAVARARSR